MRKPKPTANPSIIASLVSCWKRGLLTEEELLRLKREALGMNYIAGKEKNENRIPTNRTLKFGKN
jgi:hypothetical protein